MGALNLMTHDDLSHYRVTQGSVDIDPDTVPDYLLPDIQATIDNFRRQTRGSEPFGIMLPGHGYDGPIVAIG